MLLHRSDKQVSHPALIFFHLFEAFDTSEVHDTKTREISEIKPMIECRGNFAAVYFQGKIVVMSVRLDQMTQVAKELKEQLS